MSEVSLYGAAVLIPTPGQKRLFIFQNESTLHVSGFRVQSSGFKVYGLGFRICFCVQLRVKLTLAESTREITPHV